MKTFINKYLSKFGVAIHGVGYIKKLKSSDPKKNEWAIQKKILNNRVNVIFDVGANRGNTSLKYASLFPKAKIHAFEPFPDSCKKFVLNHKNNMNIKLNHYALSNKVGKASLNINKSVDTNSFLKSKKIGANSDKHCVSTGNMVVKTNTIDNYCKKNNIKEIDVLKIDVQGSELKVLEGAIGLLKNQKIKLIYTETYFKQQYINQPLFHDISKFLYNYNFNIQDVYDLYFSEENLLWCDSIFVNSKK